MQSLTVENELTIFTALKMKAGLLAFLDSGSHLEIDLSQVVEIDTAGLQILILIKREAVKAGKSLKFVMHSKPVLEIMELANLTTEFGDHPRRPNVVVVHSSGTKTGLVVDRLIGEFQTVIKLLGKLFGHVEGLGGSTILGSGEMALILDVPVLVSSVELNGHRSVHKFILKLTGDYRRSVSRKHP